MGLTAFIAETVDGVLEGVPGASLQVTVEKPNGVIVDNLGFDINDQGDGTYNITLKQADQEGTYDFRVIATIDPGTDRFSRIHMTADLLYFSAHSTDSN